MLRPLILLKFLDLFCLKSLHNFSRMFLYHGADFSFFVLLTLSIQFQTLLVKVKLHGSIFVFYGNAHRMNNFGDPSSLSFSSDSFLSVLRLLFQSLIRLG